MNRFFELKSVQRYFHFVALKAGAGYELTDLWRDFGVSVRSGRIKSWDDKAYTIQHARYTTDYPYYRGNDDYSINEDSEPPYEFDIFAIYLRKNRTILIGFPFKLMANHLLDTLVSKKRILLNGHFLRIDLDTFIKLDYRDGAENKESPYELDNFNAIVLGISLSLSDTSQISMVDLNGKNPLSSEIYRNVFYSMLAQSSGHIAKSSMRCHLLSNTLDLPRSHSIIHMDVYGNFKMYIHQTGNNIFTLPALVQILQKHHCLPKVNINPIKRLVNEKAD